LVIEQELEPDISVPEDREETIEKMQPMKSATILRVWEN
jgi:hypothetical protein